MNNTIRIRIHKGAEIVNQATGETRRRTMPIVVNATRDAQSGCMLFTTPLGTFYVCDPSDYTVVPA